MAYHDNSKLIIMIYTPLDTRNSSVCPSGSGDPPPLKILNELDWRALVELHTPNIGKLMGIQKLHIFVKQKKKM